MLKGTAVGTTRERDLGQRSTTTANPPPNNPSADGTNQLPEVISPKPLPSINRNTHKSCRPGSTVVLA